MVQNILFKESKNEKRDFDRNDSHYYDDALKSLNDKIPSKLNQSYWNRKRILFFLT